MQNEIKKLTEKDILNNVRNQALENKINSLISLDILAESKTNEPKEKEEMAQQKIKFENGLKRFTDLIRIIDKRLKVA